MSGPTHHGATYQAVQRSAAARIAVLLAWALAGLLVARALLTFLLLDSLLDARTADFFGTGNEELINSDFGRDIIENWKPDYPAVALFLLTLGVVLALCAVFIAAGARWARIVGIGFSVLTMVMAGGQVFGSRPWTMLFAVLDVVIAVIAPCLIYYLFRAGKKAPIAH